MGWDFLNSIPIIGHVKAGIEAATGDTDAARRTAAAATGGLLSTVGAVGGFVVGGPPGAVAGGALGNVIGGQIERKINGQDLDLSPGKLMGDAVLGGAAGAIGGGGAGNAAKGLAQGLGKEMGKSVLEAGIGSIGKTLAASTGQQLIKGVTDSASSSTDKKADPKPETGDKDPDVDEELVDVVTQEQDNKARDVDNYANQFTTIYPPKWPDLGKTNDKQANISDMIFNVMPMVTSMIRHGELFQPAYVGWYHCTEDYNERSKDGRVQRAVAIIAQNPVLPPAPDLEQWIKGLEEKMFALNGEMAKGGEKVMKPKIGGNFTPGKGGNSWPPIDLCEMPSPTLLILGKMTFAMKQQNLDQFSTRNEVGEEGAEAQISLRLHTNEEISTAHPTCNGLEYNAAHELRSIFGMLCKAIVFASVPPSSRIALPSFITYLHVLSPSLPALMDKDPTGCRGRGDKNGDCSNKVQEVSEDAPCRRKAIMAPSFENESRTVISEVLCMKHKLSIY